MKRYIKSESLLTESDYRAALLGLRHARNPKDVERAQKIIKEYKAKNPELAEKIKNQIESDREARRHSPKHQSKYRC